MPDHHTPYTNHLARLSDDDLTVQAGKVKAMLESEAWILLTSIVDEARLKTAERAIMGHAGINGRILEQAEYARLHGYLAGTSELQVAAESFALALEKRKRENTT